MEINLKAPGYLILTSTMLCPECGRETEVFALGLLAGYEILQHVDDDDVDSPEEWAVPGLSALLCGVGYLPEQVAWRIQLLTQNFRLDRDPGRRRKIWMNHCEHCGAKLVDEDVQDSDTPDGPFEETSAASIKVCEVAEPFEGHGCVACDDPDILRMPA